MALLQFTPKIFTLLKGGYGFSDFRADVISGLTVAIVALPLAMALSVASGASPDKGLITAVIAGFFISLLGGSRVQIGGPTGAFIVVVFNVISKHGYDGLLLATILAGVILIVAGYARLGQVIKFIPHPVITGFTAGIAIIIASSQVKDFLGLQISDVPAEFIPKWAAYFNHFYTLNINAVQIGIIALVIIVLLKRYLPKLPAYLIAITIVSAIVYILNLPIDTIGSRYQNIPSGLPLPALPEWNLTKFLEIVPSAFTIAFLAGIEALLSAIVADSMTGYKHRSNQELVSQGVANIASAFFGGLPATGAIARTATNIKAGGKTPIAGISHSVFLFLFILFAADVMKYVPFAALAAILFVVAWNMSEVHHFVHIFRLSKSDRTVMLLTFILTVMVDLTVAIAVGVSLASLLFMYHMSKVVSVYPQYGRVVENNDNEKEEQEQRLRLKDGVEVLSISGPVFFGMSSALLDTLQSIGDTPKVLIIRMKLVPYMDVAGVNAIENLVKDCKAKNIKVIFSEVQPQPKNMLEKIAIIDNTQNFLVSKYDEAITLSSGLV